MSNQLRMRRYGNSGAYYLELRDHPHDQAMPGVSKRTVNVHQLIADYDGPALFIDFDEKNRAIGIEILYSTGEEDDSTDEESTRTDIII